jgi:hypothetical protein
VTGERYQRKLIYGLTTIFTWRINHYLEDPVVEEEGNDHIHEV